VQIEQAPPASHLEQLRHAVAIAPTSAQARLKLGTALLRSGSAAQAEAELRRALEIDPECAGAWVNLGGIQLGRWDFAGAVESNRRAAACDPKLLAAHYNQGLGHMYQGQAELMLGCFQRVLELDPGHAGGAYHVAVALLGLGRMADARHSLARAVHLGYSPEPDLLRALERAELAARTTSDPPSEHDEENPKS
jgi:Flp pilus assembly protein TadD